MDPLAQLKAILDGKPTPEAEEKLKEVLASPPPPPAAAKPREPTLADLLARPAPAPAVNPALDLLKQSLQATPPKPPVPLTPDASPFAGIGRQTTPYGYSGVSLFSGITEARATRKPREKKSTSWKDDPEKKEPVEKLSLLLLKELGDDFVPHGNSAYAQLHRAAGVEDSFELRRILDIPRRPSTLDRATDLTEQFKRPGGTMTLWPIQSIALEEAARVGGLLAPVGVGFGKTLISLLIGMAMRAKRIVLLVPPQLRHQLLEQDIPHLSDHWKLPLDRLRVVAYSELSNAKSHDILDQEAPDLIVADECHNLRHRSAARTKRFLRYMKQHPECRFVGLSGTITNRSLRDYQHLSELALQKSSPLPRNWRDLEDWSLALDVTKKDPMPPGALVQLCTDEEAEKVRTTPNLRDAQVFVRQAFRRRLVETLGVVATEESALGTSLVITGLWPEVPAEVQIQINRLHDKWEIDDEELIDPLAVARVSAQLAAGFHYRWVWPTGKKDHEWLEARKAWNRELRDILKLSRAGLDSPMLVVSAIEHGRFTSGTYAAWAKIKNRYNPVPPTEAVWHDKFLVHESVKWGNETCTRTEPGIIWYTHDEFGREVAKAGGFPFFGPGAEASAALAHVKVKDTPVIVCSMRAHGTGKNLQMFSRNLFTIPPAGGSAWEQTIARTHRPGQQADEVAVDVFLHTKTLQQNLASAIRDAQYVEQTQGQRSKLLYARMLECSRVTL